MIYFGWDTNQYALAKGRYNLYENNAIQEDEVGLIFLRKWWEERGYVDPMQVNLEGVDMPRDNKWAFSAIHNAAINSRY